jgi:hypothetical protein
MKIGFNHAQKIISGLFGIVALLLTVVLLDRLTHQQGSLLGPVLSLMASGAFFLVAASD